LNYYYLRKKIHAFALNETALTPKQSGKIPHFTLPRQDNSLPALRANGGVAMGFSPTIPHRLHHAPLPNLPEFMITTLYYKSIYITLVTIYIRPAHAIPHSFFKFVSDNFRNYLIMVDINIHSRSHHEKEKFQHHIRTQTKGTILQIPNPTRPESNTTSDVVICSTYLIQRCHLSVLDLIGSDHAPIKLTPDSQAHPHPSTLSPRIT